MLARVAVTILALSVLAACGSGEETAESQPAPTVEETQAPNPDRERAPEITGRSLEGDAVALADLTGRPVLLNVWSSW